MSVHILQTKKTEDTSTKLGIAPLLRDLDMFRPDISPARTIPPPFLHGVGHFPLPPPPCANL